MECTIQIHLLFLEVRKAVTSLNFCAELVSFLARISLSLVEVQSAEQFYSLDFFCLTHFG